MNNLESKLFYSSFDLLKYKKCWYAYVDDVFCVWWGFLRQLDKFLTIINSLHPSIVFTQEQETNHFLHLTISAINQKLHFSIFRKPYTDHPFLVFSTFSYICCVSFSRQYTGQHQFPFQLRISIKSLILLVHCLRERLSYHHY
ncbi:hypothetical protein J437_LFUL012154 [Ladona fulva]|uniref:Uncharacterized protein n=1 Tax=Ladona fulva TaxID=123851 RepID=A0A8K0P1D0_LADFU|nr:hypothetical protein J437_LFUL012154 [Ladona fulva]